jgi:hypothetical protein
MPGDIYSTARDIYSLFMRTPRTAYARLSTQLTEAEEAILRRAKDNGVAGSLSDALDKALRAFLGRQEVAVEVSLPSKQGELRKRNYRIADDVSAMLNDAAARYGYDIQDLVRAAVHWSGKAHGPTQSGR